MKPQLTHTLVALVVLAGALTTVDLQAQAAAEVEAAVRAHYAAVNAGDIETAAGHHAPNYSLWFVEGGDISRYTTVDAQRSAFVEMQEEGFAIDWEIGDLHVDVEGEAEDVGIATFQVTGSVTLPGGEPEQGTWRVSEVWVRHGDEWREVHAHISPMTTP